MEPEGFRKAFRGEGWGWRVAARIGARYGPTWWLTLGPPLVGMAFGLALRDKRERVRQNLRRVRGVRSVWAESSDIAATFRCYAACLAEGLAVGRSEATAARVLLRGAEHLQSATSSGRGVVVVTAHVGPWEAASQVLGRRESRGVTTVMTREPEAAARALHDSVRAAAGVAVYHSGDEPLASLGLLRVLRDGGFVAAQLDRCPVGVRSMSVQLLGQSVGVPLGPFLLASLAGVPVVPVFIWRRACFDYQGEAGVPLYLPRRPHESELRGAVEQATSAMEAFIRQHPTQWFHFSDG